MKPTSIIFLVIALLLSLGGFVTMRIAESLAAKEGIELLPKSESEDYIFKYDFTDETVGKIDIDVKDADVNIICGAEKSEIELINFPEGLYEFSCTNPILRVSNNSDLTNFDSLTTLVMNFKGLRSLINLYNIKDLEKTVNVYIAADTEIKVVECKLGKGNIKLSDGATDTDYNLTIDSGNIDISNINTTSAIDCELGSGNLTIADSVVQNLRIEAESAKVELLRCDPTFINAEIGKGSFDFSYKYNLGYVNLDLFTGLGDVTVDSTALGGYFQALDMPSITKYSITLESGDITLESLPPDFG